MKRRDSEYERDAERDAPRPESADPLHETIVLQLLQQLAGGALMGTPVGPAGGSAARRDPTRDEEP